jgi:hypothetical protein
MAEDSPEAAKSTKALADLAREIYQRNLQDESLPPDEQILALEQYSQAFTAWQTSLLIPLERAVEWPREEQEHLRDLGNWHEKLLALAESLRKDTLKERKALSKKGAGLLAYVDGLPKSLSIFRTRKG